MLKTVLIILAVAIMGFVLFQSKSSGSDPDRIDVETFKMKYQEDKGVVIDVRTAGEHKSGHLAITDHNYDVTNGQFQSKLADLDKEETYYLYCRSGSRSNNALQMMKKNGFKKVYNIGGYSALARAGLETSK